MKKTLKIVVALLLCMTVVFACAACTNSSPKSVVKAYVSAMNKGNVDKILSCCYFSTETGKGAAKDTLNAIYGDGKDADYSYKISNLEVSDETDESATVKGTLKTTYKDSNGNEKSSEDTVTYKCVKKDGKWYVTYNPLDWIFG